MKKRITEEETQKIIHNYLVLKHGRGKSGKEFGLNEAQVKKILLENNIKLRTFAESRHKKYKVNDHFFSNQNHNMAYVMGLIAADGNISAKDNRIEIELASVDKEILDEIRKTIELEREIKVYECSNGYVKNKLYVHSAQMKKDLKEYGIVPNKTYSKEYTFPYKLKEEYVIDYIRGLFDGDGSVKKATSLAFQIDSSCKTILVEIQNFLKEKYGINTNIGKEKKVNIDLYRIYCYGENAKKVYDILYTPNSLFLKRKKEKWEELL